MQRINCELWDCSVQIYRQATKGECPEIVNRLMAIANSMNNESRKHEAAKAEKAEFDSWGETAKIGIKAA